MRKAIAILILIGLHISTFAAGDDGNKIKKKASKVSIEVSDTLTDEFLDTVTVKKKLKLRLLHDRSAIRSDTESDGMESGSGSKDVASSGKCRNHLYSIW